jgi:hypothetical protein
MSQEALHHNNNGRLIASIKFTLMKKMMVILFLFIGCSVAKKDNKAVQRVSAKLELLNIVGAQWEKINPCVPAAGKEVYIHDTTVITLPPKVIVDQHKVRLIIDSLTAINDGITDSIKDKMTDAYNLGVEYAERYYRSLPTKHIVDTIKITLPDARKEAMMKDTIAKRDVFIGTLNGKIEQLQKDYKSLIWKMVGMVVALLLLGVIIGLLIKAKIL